jgi:hypothetical protein
VGKATMTGYNKEFDIPAKAFDFKKDLEFGHLGEDMVRAFYEKVIQGKAEVKTDRYRNGRMVVETQQNPRRQTLSDGSPMWVHSGINVTTADWWVYVFAIDQSMVIISVPRLRRYLKAFANRFNEETKVTFARESDNPARGFLLEPFDVTELLISPKYDA